MGTESGQSLVIVVLAMSLIVAMAAFSIDVSQWYVSHHKAQVAADATALAAANCLASTVCTTTTANGDTETKANTIANADGFSNGNVSYAFTSSTVKVTVNGTAPTSFGGLFGIHSVNTSATATASYNTLQNSSSCGSTAGGPTCYSLFAANDVCPSSTPAIPNYVGLDLVMTDNGAGHATVTNVFSNAYFMSNAQSSASSFTVTTVGNGSPACSESPGKGNATYKYVPTTLPYPEVWTEPTGAGCNFSGTSFTPAAIQTDGPGVYCLTASPTPACADQASNMTQGYIYANMSILPAGGYEFVGPCVIVAGQSTTATNISGQPLVFGTSNIQTSNGTPEFATSSALPTCVKNDGTNLSSTFLDGNPSAGPAIYDQCGTVEMPYNGGYTGFVEAWNISLDKNNAVIGNGPTSITPGSGVPLPGGDALTG